jgi:hypothetical protein
MARGFRSVRRRSAGLVNCANCGAPIDTSARFCAHCGEAAAAGPPAGDSVWWQDDGTTVPPVATTLPPAAARPEPNITHAQSAPPTAPGAGAPSKRSRATFTKPLLVALALIGMGVVAYFVVGALRGKNGATSPQAAVTRATDAISHEDPVGILNALNPGEVHDLAAVYSKARDRADKSGIKGDHPNIEGALLGLENVKFVNPKFEVERLSSDVAKVTLVDGTLSWDAVPTQNQLTRRFGSTDDTDTGSSTTKQPEQRSAADLRYTTTDTEGRVHVVQPFLMTVKRGGGWYVSATYTAAEEVVEALGLPEPDFSSSSRPSPVSLNSAATPEAAIRGLAQAISDKSVLNGSAFLSDDEGRAARDYAASFQSLISENLASSDAVNIRFDNLLTTQEDGGNGYTKVTIESATGSIVTNSDDETMTTNFAFDGSCLRNAGDGSDSEPSCIAQRFKDLTGINKVFVLMKKQGGHYTVSPIATVLAYAKSVEQAVPDTVVDRMLGAYNAAPGMQPLAAGQLVEGQTNDAGFAVYSFSGTKGQRLGLLGDDQDSDGLEFKIIDAAGATVGTDTYGSSFVLPAAGQYRIVVVASGLAKTGIKFRLDAVQPKTEQFPVADRVAVAPYQTAAVQFDVNDASSDYTVNVATGGDSSTANTAMVGPDGNATYCATSCTFQTGRYTLYIFGTNLATTWSVAIAKVSLGFSDGSTTATGSLGSDGESQSFTLNTVPNQSITVTVDCGASLDCVLDVGDQNSDSAELGGTESVNFTPDSDSVSVVVRSYSGYGDFSVSVS